MVKSNCLLVGNRFLLFRRASKHIRLIFTSCFETRCRCPNFFFLNITILKEIFSCKVHHNKPLWDILKSSTFSFPLKMSKIYFFIWLTLEKCYYRETAYLKYNLIKLVYTSLPYSLRSHARTWLVTIIVIPFSQKISMSFATSLHPLLNIVLFKIEIAIFVTKDYVPIDLVFQFGNIISESH